MMNLGFRQILLIVIGLLSAIIMPAQDLPVLPADPALKSGVLKNGMSYYIVANPTTEGMADFALIQKTGRNTADDVDPDKVVKTAQDALACLPRCLSSSPQAFMTSKGVTPGGSGFVDVTEDATIFHFEDVILTSETVLDSTLLVLLDIVDRVSTSDDDFIRKWYAPSDQAVVIAGDVDPVSLESKLRYMSMMTPAKESEPRPDYVWEEQETAVYETGPGIPGGLVSVTATWRMARPSWEYMNTVQPMISEMFISELGMIAREKILEDLGRQGIPVADVSCSYLPGYKTSDDEKFAVKVCVKADHFMEAVSSISRVMSDIDAGMTSSEDLARIKRICIDAAHDETDNPITDNSELVDKCASAFLYNGSLATFKTKVDFLSSRKLADTTELRLFNGISSAILDKERNLTVSYTADFAGDFVKTVFDYVWDEEPVPSEKSTYGVEDIKVSLPEDKVKIKTTKQDPMSSGTVWTFANGFSVVYKKMPTEGRLHYVLAQNDGFCSIKDLAAGEGGYVADYLLMGKISGMPGRDFVKLLNSEGITIDSHVGLSAMMVSGVAPKQKADLLMKALLAVMYQREPDKEAAKEYADNEALRRDYIVGSAAERTVIIDSLMCPDYIYSSKKALRMIPENLQDKAESYFRSQSEKMNDGVLVILGDMDESDLKKVLSEHVGGFRTDNRTFRRTPIRYQPSSGESTYVTEGTGNSVEIAMSAPLALTTDNYMAAQIAAMVLKKRLADALENSGMTFSLSHDCKIYPQERINILISLEEAADEGFATGVDRTGPIVALAVVRSVLADLQNAEVSDQDMKAFKAQLKDRIKLEMNDPYYWLNAISRRQLSGKDFTTGYGGKTDAVTSVKVKWILSSLDKGSKVEYIIRKK